MNISRGFTLLELVIVIIIISIISVSGVWIMFSLIQGSVFIPNQLNMDMLAKQALDIMIEGDVRDLLYAYQGARGLLFSRAITNLADNNLTFINQDNKTITYRLDTATSRLYRDWDMDGDNVTDTELIPYYAASGITVRGKNNKLFTYYAVNETVTSVPANVRRIQISLIAKTGSGSFTDWQGQSAQNSSIAVYKFQ